MFYKPSKSSGTPLKYSKAAVSFKNIPSTILKGAGLNYEKYGIPIDEIGEDEDIVRNYYKAVVHSGHEDTLYLYEVRGDAADFQNWVQVDKRDIEHYFW